MSFASACSGNYFRYWRRTSKSYCSGWSIRICAVRWRNWGTNGFVVLSIYEGRPCQLIWNTQQNYAANQLLNFYRKLLFHGIIERQRKKEISLAAKLLRFRLTTKLI